MDVDHKKSALEELGYTYEKFEQDYEVIKLALTPPAGVEEDDEDDF